MPILPKREWAEMTWEDFTASDTSRWIAVLPLAPAADNDAVTVLPAVPLSGSRGPHQLCFTFTQRTLDPMWALDWVQLAP